MIINITELININQNNAFTSIRMLTKTNQRESLTRL